ncbi:xanthine dehydrogenase accessory factor [Arthrobacter stackebrandtii]|uniref:Xanthine dehydrogenase accessory factor n=1 Tax=Arthrobacter stackebrandtii TaxID=272161 RepID=A0ABS4Z251_9MICC|nr:xanthine dehydrogenase accessory protein XdhC [Arthrobacter stackebrandtii]MBP2415054.1 xanthine dehydrogenase accessory factor [Arthrobacter stackebrandtii]PYH00802.1 xanthine dehydrogenase accessory protein XdhC [Arthrobacter stackebrandtii]
MDWLEAATHLRSLNEPAVIATLVQVRGHAPREPGAKMVVSAAGSWGTVGGGNFEAEVIDRARELMSGGTGGPELMSFPLSDKAPTRHGVQCCGGEVSVLLELLPSRRTVAVFGMGHVGFEIAHILSRLPIDLVLADSRPDAVEPARMEPLTRGPATTTIHHAPAPETVLQGLPAGAAVLVLTHDHAEDLILCDTALRAQAAGAGPGYLGLIGSRSKWQRFRKRLLEEGHTEEELARITCPIGLAEITGKEPISIAVGVAADLVLRWEREKDS